MNDYYVTVDKETSTVSVSTYIFNCFVPNGVEKNLSTIHYEGKSGFSLPEAEDVMSRLAEVLNGIIGVRRMMCMTNIKLLKEEVINLKENLESIECDDPSLNKLYDRVYSLKMSLLNVDKELSELNFLTKKDIQRSQSLLVLKDFYRNELRSLEMVL